MRLDVFAGDFRTVSDDLERQRVRAAFDHAGKPRLWLVARDWVCCARGKIGVGASPGEAYRFWRAEASKR